LAQSFSLYVASDGKAITGGLITSLKHFSFRFVFAF
jgi:hypothetical protein